MTTTPTTQKPKHYISWRFLSACVAFQRHDTFTTPQTTPTDTLTDLSRNTQDLHSEGSRKRYVQGTIREGQNYLSLGSDLVAK
ncbi:hypothetical protein E2C01_027646 [Portunus trituberculatus]|uniref:Uncharacterized protein n=1 Tax=Portunus trituberculatus TaxID=210409 RepID=A0A5B7EJA3_PORTR|nr:hypothetical protein [Portunus trituberculatus]